MGWGSPGAGGLQEGAGEPAGRPCRMGSGHGLIGRAAARRGRLLAGGHKLFCLRSRSRHRLGLAGPGAVQPPRAELATRASSQTPAPWALTGPRCMRGSAQVASEASRLIRG